MESLRPLSIFFIALFYTVLPSTAGAAVGVTPGVGAVTDRGAATYTIPLKLPGDRMTPTLAISYDHTRGDGLLGIGFAISGFSTIQRCNKTPLGGRAAPDLLADDMYCLDGQKLRLTSGNWGQPNSTYQTELETFARVTALGTTDGGGGLQGGPERWEVWTRDGLIHEYGFTSDSRILSVGSNVYRAWALNRIRDRVGNYIDFSYTIDTANGSYRPNQITYSGNTMQGVQPSTRVLFVYETANRPDPIYLYRYGDDSPSAGLIVEFRRLDRIEIVSIPSSAVLRKYEISYETAGTTGRSRMSSLQECAGADCLASTTFQWINGTAGFWPESSPGVTVPAPSNGALVVDFDNDGQQDLLYSSSTTSGTGSWRVSKGSNTGPTASVDTGAANWNYANAQTMEWSGDGATDLLVPCSNGTTWCIFHARTGTPPNQVFSPTPLDTGISTSGSGTSVSGDWLAADIDGNGRSDLLRIATNPTGGRDVYVRLGMPQGGGFTAEDHLYLGTQDLSFTPFLAAKKLTTLKRFDIDGDGAEDIFFQESFPNGLKIVEIQFSKFRRANFFFHPDQEFLYMGDFNGDGLSDLAYAGTNWYIRHSNGGSFAPTPLTGPSAANLVRAFVVDYDGDGKSDVMMATSTSPNWLVARSTGNGLAAFVDTGLSSAATAMVAPADFDGDGLKDFIRVDSSAGNAVKYVKKRQNVPDLLDRVTDGYGNFVDFGYLSTGQDDSSYVKGAGLWPLQPARDFNDPMIVVKMMQANDGIGGTYTEGHFYTGGAFDLDGRDFVGFKKHERTDTRDQSTVIETYNQVFPYIGTLASRRLENLGHLLKQETFTWSSIHFDPDVPNPNHEDITVREFPYLATHVEDLRDRVGAGEPEVSLTTTTNVFDSWGTLTDRTVQTREFFTGLQNGAVHTRRVWHPVVLNDTTNWCLGKPSETEAIASSSLPSGATLTRTAAQSWDSFYCRLTSETVEPGDPNWQAATSYSYDDFGNINGITATPATGHNQLPRTTTLNWGTTGRFLSSITNPLSQTLSLGWDSALGLRTSVTDANSLTTNWHYDAFGRITSVDHVDGTATSLNRSVCNTPACQSGNTNIRTLLEQVALDTADQEITRARFYLDQYGRTLVKQVKLLDDSFSNVTVSYNARGLVSQYSMPFTNSAAATYTAITYDFRGRPTLIRRPTSAGDPTNHDTQFTYEGLKTVRTDALGKIRTTYSDAIGRVIRSIDALSSAIDYEYDAFDNLVKTRDPLGSEAVFGYNVRGFKVSSTDPDMGPWQYGYYPLGELRSLTDAKGQTTTFTYDKLSRPTSRTMPEGAGSIVSTFTWGTSATAKNIGRLEWEEITGTGVTTYRETYAYDPTGRPSRVTYREGVTDYFVDYAYNSSTGLLETITYPTSTASFRMPVTYTYHNGLPSRVTSNGTVWWTAGTNNALGQLTSEILGDTAAGVTVETLSSYDSVTGRLGSRVATYDSGTVAGTVLTNLGIQYDRIGNVIQRQENQQGLTENFYYDDLYRLDSSTLGATTTDYGYDVRGNITSKSGVGTTYSYTANVAGCSYYSHPQIHAVRQITGGSSTQNFCYDANGNMTNRNGTSLTWFANHLPKSITKDASNSSTFEYAPSGQRWRHVYRNAGSNYTHTYIGKLVEKVVGPTTTDWKHYVYVNGEAIGMYIRRSNGAKSTHYFVQDSLGGIAAINQSNASFTMRESFDAFGKRRGQNWTGVPSATDLTRMNDTTRRGFTFHEHLDSTGLVHMNGRVYDPAIGRFASADPFIQAPLFSQSLNRYSYLFNNPLAGSDPTGFMGPGPEDEPGGGGSFGQPDTPPPLWNDPIYLGQVSELMLAGWSVGMAQEYLLNLNLPPLDLSTLDLSGLNLGNLDIPPINVPPIEVPPTTADPASPTDPPGGQPPDPTPGPTSIVESSPASTVSGTSWWNRETTVTFCGRICAAAWNGDPNSQFAPQENTATNGQRVINAVSLVTLPLAGLGAGAGGAAQSSRALVPLGEWLYYNGTSRVVAGYNIFGNAGRVGATYNVNVLSLGATTESQGLYALLGALRAEAVASGATRISISGEWIVNRSLIPFLTRVGARFGLQVETVNAETIILSGAL
jgi:RHS repeat-associated protein